MEYKVNDQELNASTFITFVNRVWPGDYDLDKTQLLTLAKDNTPTMLYFGAQPGAEGFYEKNGCQKSLQSYLIDKED